MDTKSYPEEINIQKYWLVLRRRWLVTTAVVISSVALAGVVAQLQKPAFQATGKLLFKTDRASALTGVGEKGISLDSVKEANPLDTQAEIIRSGPVLEEVIKTLQLKDKNGKLIDPELIKIKVERIIGTDILRVSYTGPEPEQAAALVNTLMDKYIEKDILTNRQEALSARKFIQGQLPLAGAELNKAAENLRQFKAKNQVIELEKEAEKAVDTLAKLDEELNKANSDLAELTAQQTAIKAEVKMPVQQAVSLTQATQSPGVQAALTELQKIQTQLAAATTRFTDDHPTVVNLKQEEAALQNLLKQRTGEVVSTAQQVTPGKLQMGEIEQKLVADYITLQVQRQGLANKITSLTTLSDSFKRRAQSLPNLEKAQQEFERRLSLAQKTYETLSTKEQEIQLAENQRIGNAQVIQPAVVPARASGFPKGLFYGAGAGIGLFLGVAAAFFIDLIDRSLKSVKEAEAVYGYTTLGLIPKVDKNITSNLRKSAIEGVSQRVIVASTPWTVIHEAYQMLQANLKFISPDKRLRSIALTSAVSGEGKSEVAANLAAAMAQSGRRVLLVDADMRQPTQHHLWGRINTVGLSNVIAGQSEFHQAVQKLTENLDILTAGVIPPNPVALIDSEWMSSLVEMFSRSYDYIIFDTPPVVGKADAAILGKMVDGVLVVARPGVVDSPRATAAKSMLTRSEANVLGLVANGVNVRFEPDGYVYFDSSRPFQDLEKAMPTKLPRSENAQILTKD